MPFSHHIRCDADAFRLWCSSGAVAFPLSVRFPLSTLFPELMEKTDSDEMLHAIAELLPDIANYLGPSPECYLAVLPPLESLMTQEETIVRDRVSKR